jgi:hypothetical protein
MVKPKQCTGVARRRKACGPFYFRSYVSSGLLRAGSNLWLQLLLHGLELLQIKGAGREVTGNRSEKDDFDRGDVRKLEGNSIFAERLPMGEAIHRRQGTGRDRRWSSCQIAARFSPWRPERRCSARQSCAFSSSPRTPCASALSAVAELIFITWSREF